MLPNSSRNVKCKQANITIIQFYSYLDYTSHGIKCLVWFLHLVYPLSEISLPTVFILTFQSKMEISVFTLIQEFWSKVFGKISVRLETFPQERT